MPAIADPDIVIVEYNYRFGFSKAITIPYDPDFVRSKVHHSMIYFGASLKALCILGEKKGYDFVGCSSNGVNAFFVKKSLRSNRIRALSVEEGYRKGNCCEYRDSEGNHEKMSPDEEIDFLMNKIELPFVEVEV